MHSKFTRRKIHRSLAGVGPGSEMEKRDLTGPITPMAFQPVPDTPTPTAQLPPTLSPPQPLVSPPLESSLTSSSQSPTISRAPLDGILPPLDISSSSSLTNASTSSSSTSSAMAAGVTISNSPTGAIISAANDPEDTQHALKLKSGAIAGIVIGCLFVIIIAVALGFRKRTVNNRLKLRGMWVGSKSLKMRNEGIQSGYEGVPQLTTNGQRSGENMGFIGRQGASFEQPTSLRGLPSAYGSEGMSGSGLSSDKIPVLYHTVVARSYVPTLPDELTISTGETLGVLQEFDDGWSECMNSAGEVGMVPLECFGKQSGSGRQTSLGR